MPVVSRPVGKKRWSSQTDLGIFWDPREDEEDGRRTKLRRIPDGSPVAGLCIPPFTVRKRDRILDAFSIKSERTRSRLPFHPIPDVHDATNEITFSRSIGNILIRPSPRLHVPRQLDDLTKLLHQLSLYFSFPSLLLLFRPSVSFLSRAVPAQALYIAAANNEGIYFINTWKRKERGREKGKRADGEK